MHSHESFCLRCQNFQYSKKEVNHPYYIWYQLAVKETFSTNWKIGCSRPFSQFHANVPFWYWRLERMGLIYMWPLLKTFSISATAHFSLGFIQIWISTACLPWIWTHSLSSTQGSSSNQRKWWYWLSSPLFLIDELANFYHIYVLHVRAEQLKQWWAMRAQILTSLVIVLESSSEVM